MIAILSLFMNGRGGELFSEEEVEKEMKMKWVDWGVCSHFCVEESERSVYGVSTAKSIMFYDFLYASDDWDVFSLHMYIATAADDGDFVGDHREISSRSYHTLNEQKLPRLEQQPHCSRFELENNSYQSYFLEFSQHFF